MSPRPIGLFFQKSLTFIAELLCQLYAACRAAVDSHMMQSCRGGARRIDARWTEPRTLLYGGSMGHGPSHLHFTGRILWGATLFPENLPADFFFVFLLVLSG